MIVLQCIIYCRDMEKPKKNAGVVQKNGEDPPEDSPVVVVVGGKKKPP